MTKQTASAKLNKLTARAGSDTDLENCIEQEKVRRRTKSQTIPREPERAKNKRASTEEIPPLKDLNLRV